MPQESAKKASITIFKPVSCAYPEKFLEYMEDVPVKDVCVIDIKGLRLRLR
jgi:hypothetical protein